MTHAPFPARRRFARKLAGAAVRLIVIVVAGVLACAALVRYSPGFESEESDIDSRISRRTALAIHRRLRTDDGFLRFAANYFANAGRGDLGVSRVFQTPVSDLVRERAQTTASLMVSGIALAWIAGTVLAWLAVWHSAEALRVAAEVIAGVSLAVPPAVIAVVFFLAGAPLSVAMALAILPRIFGTLRELLEDVWRSPALTCARARGISPLAIAVRYVARPIAPQLAALLGVSLVLAFGSAIPIEALCDVAGLGQLAWRAALGRDLPLLCAMAMLVTFTVALAQSVAEVFEKPAAEVVD